MADLYESNESEDMSSFLQILLHNSSSSAAASDSAAGVYYGGVGTAMAVAESSSSINFSDPTCFFAKESDGMNSSSKESQANEAQANPPPPRSSKRSRAAEVHNMSEKRRRSRINEKLKALQNLIPNSNKTDKASMLDEAIEYLKQLQLQVQMLTVRNGLSLHPGYSLGSLQSMLASSAAGIEFDEGNTFPDAHNRVPNSVPNNQNVVYMQTRLETNHPNNSTHPALVPLTPNASNSGSVGPSFVPTMQNRYGLLNHVASTKDICRDETLSRMQLDGSCSGNNSSPGVSSSS